MFTGLVQEIGQIARVTTNRGGRTFRIACGFQDYDLGESISVDGTCLTVKAFDDDGFSADASQETLAKTTLAGLSAGAHVHLERAVHAGEPLGGHIVTGHVDGVGKLVSRQLVGDAVEVSFGVPHALRAFLAPKGSITVNGVSLTINAAGADDFEVTLVPYTREHTTFDGLPDGSDVNLEVDILAKYVARLLGKAGVDGVELSMGVGLDQLARGGYL
jgi:riboflavin synthase